MGHRHSKAFANTCESIGTTTTTAAAATTNSNLTHCAAANTPQEPHRHQGEESGSGSWSAYIPITASASVAHQTINLQIQDERQGQTEQEEQPENRERTSSASSLSLMNSSHASASSSHRQIIIKIQLAKMMNDHGLEGDEATALGGTGCVEEENGNAVTWDDFAETAGGFANDSKTNNNYNKQDQIPTTTKATTTYPLLSQLSLERRHKELASETDDATAHRVMLRNPSNGITNDIPEYIDVLEGDDGEAEMETVQLESGSGVVAPAVAVCNRCQKSKRRCCKCTCLGAFRRILEPSTKSQKNKILPNAACPTESTTKHSKSSSSRVQHQRHSLQASPSSSSSSHRTTTQRASVQPQHASSSTQQNQLAIWTAGERPAATVAAAGALRNDVIIPLNPPFLVVQCPPRTSVVTVGGLDDTIHVVATEFVANQPTATTTSNATSNSPSSATLNVPSNATLGASPTTTTAANRSKTPFGPIVHSQVDFVHYLVPDLEKITNSSFYWGKMDRYEAERLLEGKPEGTFLLRDSAQEEFLFSVTFRKYGRSLHARIEQSGHKFSFDCHDPNVFTAPTVTELLEHYKDPSCVMFFEPMLTIPLHRNKPFSLQQLCRATIVSHTSYDGVGEMELPSRLKAYLKEYHYKQKLRVKPFDEPFYTSII